MFEWLTKFLQAFIPLFVAIDPIGLAAIFLGLGQTVPPERRQKIADQAIWTGGLVALGFLFLGQSVFKALGISVSDFQLAGGLILYGIELPIGLMLGHAGIAVIGFVVLAISVWNLKS